jgi:hypothetical protein
MSAFQASGPTDDPCGSYGVGTHHDRGEKPMQDTATKPLGRDLLKKMDAYWRAANYLSVG